MPKSNRKKEETTAASAAAQSVQVRRVVSKTDPEHGLKQVEIRIPPP